jgi:hypothetical protein
MRKPDEIGGSACFNGCSDVCDGPLGQRYGTNGYTTKPVDGSHAIGRMLQWNMRSGDGAGVRSRCAMAAEAQGARGKRFIGCNGSAEAIAAAIGDELGHPDPCSKS